jgi:hypothetical protein
MVPKYQLEAEIRINAIQRGVLFANGKLWGIYNPPPNVFSKKIPGAPLNNFFSIFVSLAWGPRSYLGNVKESQHVLLSGGEHLA